MTDLRKAAEEAAKVLANALSIDFNDKRDWYSYKHDVEYAANILCQALAQPEQSPVAWQFFDDGEWHYGTYLYDHRKNTEADGYPVRDLYTAPPKREWVGLTDEERNEMIGRIQHDQYTRKRDLINSTQIITEMYLKEKNGG